MKMVEAKKMIFCVVLVIFFFGCEENGSAVVTITEYYPNGELYRIIEEDTVSNTTKIKAYYKSGNLEKAYQLKLRDRDTIYVGKYESFYDDKSQMKWKINFSDEQDIHVHYRKSGEIERVDTVKNGRSKTYVYNKANKLSSFRIYKNKKLIYKEDYKFRPKSGKPYKDIHISPDSEIEKDTFVVRERMKFKGRHPKPRKGDSYLMWVKIEKVGDEDNLNYYIGDSIRLDSSGFMKDEFQLFDMPGEYKVSSIIHFPPEQDTINDYTGYPDEKIIYISPLKL